MTVPVDYRNPAGRQLTLAVTRAPALDPSSTRGTIVFNPGGPGESGNQILPVALALLPASVRDQFDIVSFDPRGTGASDPLQCGTPVAAVSSVLPLPSAPGKPLPGTAVFSAMARACAHQPLEPFLDTVNTARDMDRIRQALGLARISYYGLSYGTVLGSVYADLFPHHIERMVLDGAVDVDATLAVQAQQEAPAAERSLLHLLDTCAHETACPLGPHPRAFLTDLLSSLSRKPLPAPGSGDTSPVTVGDLDTATLFALSVPAYTPLWYTAVVDAAHGDGASLRNLALGFDTDIDGAPLVDPEWAITCNDSSRHTGPVAAGNLARALGARYPLLGAYAVTYNLGGCVSWPAARQPVDNLHPRGTPPILVIGNTGDPNTPIVGARHLAALLPSARLLTWQGWGHTWLLSGSGDGCMQEQVTRYLDGGGLPSAGTVCR